ncbi:MAG: hypothetical protein FH748_05365 [Balneolaceae bacterium]|nr:hypothetical protein [Balneolaceae bacterium]
MNKETARMLFMEYLYDELEEDQKTELENFLDANPALKAELEELSNVRSMLSHLPVKDPAGQIVLVEPETNSWFNWWNNFIDSLILRSKIAKAGFALGMCLLLFISIASLTKMNVKMGSDGFHLSFGEPQTVQQGFTADQLEQLITQVKEDNARMVAQLVETAQEEQQKQFEETLINFADYVEQQRTSDLKLISTGLTNLDETYYDRFRQTDQVLGEIIQTVSRND